MTYIFIYVFVLFLSLCSVKANDCDITKCPGVQKLYSEVCTAIFKDGVCCPVKYECPDFNARSKDKCYLDGREFGVNEGVPDELTKKNCVPSCRCAQYVKTESAKFICAHYDCAEYFGRRDPDCTLVYDVDSCCSTGTVCGEAKAKAYKCYFEGKEYIAGQRMYPATLSCYTCLCRNGFDNSTIVGNPNCKEASCAFDLHYSDKLLSGCIPVYYGDNECCPIDWRCPDSTKDEVVVTGRSDANIKETCTFGGLRISVGDELKTESSEVTCSCLTPPYLQCVREKHPEV